MLRVELMFVKDRASAEEVVQETWLAVLNGIDRFEGRSIEAFKPAGLRG
jgi:RNA polymerase sigma-70 factor (ECF subfamily)